MILDLNIFQHKLRVNYVEIKEDANAGVRKVYWCIKINTVTTSDKHFVIVF